MLIALSGQLTNDVSYHQASIAGADMLDQFASEGGLGPIMSLAGHISQAGFAEELHADIPDFDFPALHTYSRQHHRLESQPTLRPQVGPSIGAAL